MPAFKSHSTATVDKPWDGPANKANARSGEKRAYYGRIYGWYDPQGNEGIKESYRFVHHEVAADGTPGAANTNGCSAAIAVLNGGRGGTTIPAADRQGIWEHLAKHLRDASKEVPSLQVLDDHPLVLESIQDKPWAMLPGKLEEIAAFIDSRLAGEKIDFAAAARGKSGNRAEQRYQVQDGVAVIPVYGVLDKRMNLMMEMSGGTSTQLLARDIGQALADPEVQALVLDIESPGGAVDGTMDVADQIFAARGNGKPIVAYANGLMASAAYWIGSAASMVIANETAQVGSIGVAMMHVDRSARDAQMGLKRTAIYAGKYKRLASDEKPLSESGQEYLQSMVDDYYQIFLVAVARNRGMEPDTAHGRIADGRLFIGKKARTAGLVDKIGTFADALALAQQLGGKNMDLKTLKAQHPETFAEAKAEGAAGVTLETLLHAQPEAAEQIKAEARQEGLKTERARTVEILEAAGLKGLTFQMIQDGTEPKTALKSFLAHYDQVRAEALATMAGAAPPVVGTQPQVGTHTDEPRGDLPIEKLAMKEWEDKETGLKLQKEFGVFETYLAFRRAEKKGQIIK
jgi:signal peptide peptidase SppA